MKWGYSFYIKKWVFCPVSFYKLKELLVSFFMSIISYRYILPSDAFFQIFFYIFPIQRSFSFKTYIVNYYNTISILYKCFFLIFRLWNIFRICISDVYIKYYNMFYDIITGIDIYINRKTGLSQNSLFSVTAQFSTLLFLADSIL